MAETPESPSSSGVPQRRWQAPCPTCGAPVAFQSPSSPVAVCSYCRSTVVRDGESLKKIGESAELFNDRSALQLGTSGKFNERPFTLVGRLQFGYGSITERPDGAIEASWNEWYAIFDDGSGGWLSEDNDQYVFSFEQAPEPVPAADQIALEQGVPLMGREWRVASLNRAKLLAAEGELPTAPDLGLVRLIADLRNAQGRVATIDYADPAQPKISSGPPVRLEELQLQNLRQDPDAGSAQLKGREFACPNCGTSVSVSMGETRSLACSNCKAVIDVSQGVGAELVLFEQRALYSPVLPLGRTGRLAFAGLSMKSWQVVGFSQKSGSIDGESFAWGDYLLYNREEGFAFLNDTSEGWVVFRTLSGVPSGGGGSVTWQGEEYREVERYPAEVIYVEGEFYWLVEKSQVLETTDYNGPRGTKLSSEKAGNEVVWSRGEPKTADEISTAFNLGEGERSRLRSDVGPSSGGGGSLSVGCIVLAIVLILLFFFIIASCSDGSGSGGTSGGSYGGYNSGGGHK